MLWKKKGNESQSQQDGIYVKRRQVRLHGVEVGKMTCYHSRSTAQSNGEGGKKVKKSIQAGWIGWKQV